MKYLKKYFAFLILLLSMFCLTACGKVKVNYDLASEGGNFTYATIINMQSTPKRYLNKNFRIRGKIEDRGDSYTLYGYDNASCCSWELELSTENTDINLDNKTGYVTLLGTYKANGSFYYLDVIGFG